MTPEELDWVLSYVSQHYSCGTFQECVANHYADSHTTRPLLAITFDDAQADNHTYAQAVLEKHDIRASFFAPAMNIETGESLWHDQLAYATVRALAKSRPEVLAILELDDQSDQSDYALARNLVSSAKSHDPETLDSLFQRLSVIADLDHDDLTRCPEWAGMMSWQELRELQDAGHEIGSHSLTHCVLTNVDDAQLQQEIGESKQMIEQHLGQEVTSFCFPNGDHDARCLELLQTHGYEQACTTSWGNNAPHEPRYTLRRFDISSQHLRTVGGVLSKEILAWRMSGLYPGLAS
jgi:peptidoglycan/xylan/chitin deacetylase (PgdA/CDA1 family)